MIDFDPPNVTGRKLPEVISEFAPISPTLAAPIRTGLVVNSFDKRILTLLPPMLIRATWRMVKFEKLAGITPRGDCGLAVQVLIHEVCWDWAPAPSARSNPIKALEMSARENVGRIRVLPISVCLCALKWVKRRIMIGPGFLPSNYQN